MAALSLSIDAQRPMNRFDYDSIRPGVVGSVGDALSMVRLKHSYPDAEIRYEKAYDGNKGTYLGSNVQNGDIPSYQSKGYMARTVDSNWGGRRSFKTSRGWIWQDMRAPDKLHEPNICPQGDYSFRNKLATTYDAKRTGNMFLPLPGGYKPSPGEVDRGSLEPLVTNIEGPLPGVEMINDQFRNETPMGTSFRRLDLPQSVPGLSGFIKPTSRYR